MIYDEETVKLATTGSPEMLWLVAKWQIDPHDIGEMYEELLAVREGFEESSYKYTIMILNEVLTHLRNYVQ